jgi:hypothetical protein
MLPFVDGGISKFNEKFLTVNTHLKNILFVLSNYIIFRDL